MQRGHGHLLAGEAGELVGVPGTTIGQWARRGYIRASQSAGIPHVYSVEDVAEAAIVAALLRRGVRRADIRRAIERLRDYGEWPLSAATLATARTDGPRGARVRLLLREDGRTFVLTPRGWQTVALPVEADEVRIRLGGARASARGAS